MSAVRGASSWSMERSDMKGRSRRKRRRRCQGRGQSNTLSPLHTPVRPTGALPAESTDNSGTNSLEVKENQDDKIQVGSHLLRKYHPAMCCTTFSGHGPRALKRKQPLVDGKDRLLHQSPSIGKRAAWAVCQKNPLVHLNELRPGLHYEVVSKTGLLHAPVFSVGVEVNGVHFEGQGPTKKQAKMRAAEVALRSFIQFPNASQAHATLGNVTGSPVDFTADKLDIPEVFLRDYEPSLRENSGLLHCNTARTHSFASKYNHRQLVRLTLDLVSSSNPKRTLGTSLLEHVSPVAVLNELRPGLRYTCLTEKVPGRPMRSFVMVVQVDGRVFEGFSHSKRRAKAQAATAALQALFNLSLGPERRVMGLQGAGEKNQLPQFFAETIFGLVRQKYSELTGSHLSTSHSRHKVLAGIVMTRGFDLRSAEVVSLATGTKCLDSDGVCNRDYTVTDCHAEVIGRRALVRFLYSQLELLLRQPADAEETLIFVPSKSCGGGFRLRDDVLFHMYVSSSPCGDARLNCPYEATATYPSRRVRCHLRVKVDGGEGTLPVTPQRANQKWKGLSPGKPLIAMSCTDKLAKWCAVGLQGALLSHLLEPVYLHSLTVGTLSHTGHLGRAVARRLTPVKHLPFPYRRQQLLLGCLSSNEGRWTGKAPNVSVNWSLGDGGLEEISTSTGKRRVSGAPSQLSRRSLFTRWQRLQKQILGTGDATRTYSGSKMAAQRYQRAMQHFTGTLQGAGLGHWIRNPPECHCFSV